MSNIRVTYKYIRVTYEYTRVHTSNIRVTNDYIRVTYEYIRLNMVICRLYTNTLVTFECIGAINMKCTIFLFTFHFYMCSGHALHTCKCHTHAYHTLAPHLFTTHKVQTTVQSAASRTCPGFNSTILCK